MKVYLLHITCPNLPLSYNSNSLDLYRLNCMCWQGGYLSKSGLYLKVVSYNMYNSVVHLHYFQQFKYFKPMIRLQKYLEEKAQEAVRLQKEKRLEEKKQQLKWVKPMILITMMSGVYLCCKWAPCFLRTMSIVCQKLKGIVNFRELLSN